MFRVTGIPYCKARPSAGQGRFELHHGSWATDRDFGTVIEVNLGKQAEAYIVPIMPLRS
jgi:hypothetical protein